MPETTPSAPPALAPGRLLAGRYRLDRRLAGGGMADVWAASDEVLTRPVAVKVLHAHLGADPAFVARFKREAVAAARLSHPAIVSIYDTCSDDGVEAIVMALVRGTTLREVLDRPGALPARRAVSIAADVAGALACAHRAGLVHRDVKPGNVLVADDGRVLVTDFGIAKALQEDGDLTDAGQVMGTAKYLAPEQVDGGPADARTDVYSLGVVLYEMLTGAPPFLGDTPLATAVMRLHGEPLRPRQHRAAIPRDLERVVMRAMARRPDDRYASAEELRAELLRLDARLDDDRTRVATRDATVVAAADRPSPSFAQTERTWLVPTVVILLVAAALGITGVVVGRTDVGRSIIEGARQAVSAGLRADPPAAPVVADVASFDPGGDGEEHDHELPRLIDDDPSTRWSTERYHSHAAFSGLKDGVGVVLTLEQPARLSALEVRSPVEGWSAEVYVADRPADELDGWGDPDGSVQGASGGALVPLGGARGRAVLLWVTDLGDGEPVFEVSELTLR